jgi:AcrR family transcriptional regulator
MTILSIWGSPSENPPNVGEVRPKGFDTLQPNRARVVGRDKLRYIDTMVAKLPRTKPLEARVTPAKRDRTRAKLIRAAFNVYAREGFDAPTIDNFIAEAQVSRGTFYNYFQTREDLMVAVAADLATFITKRIASAGTVSDPLERIAIAVRYFVTLAAQNEIRGWVLARMIPIVGGPLTNAMSEHVRATMEAAVAAKRIQLRSISAGIDLGLGMIAMAIRHNLSRRAAPYPAELVSAMALQALGASIKVAEEVSNRPLPPLSVDESKPMAEGGDATEAPRSDTARQKVGRRRVRGEPGKRRRKSSAMAR